MAASGIGGRLVALPLAWLAGVALQLQQSELWLLDAYVLVLASAALAVEVTVLARRALAARAFARRAVALVGVVGALAAGFAASGWQAKLRLADSLPSALEGQDIVVTGVVASLPQQGPSGLRFRFAIEEGGAPAGVPPLLALGWYAGFHEDAALVQPRAALRAGQRWRFTVRLRQPHGNPHGFDYELALLEQGVRATGYVRDAPATLLDTAAGYPVERLRQRVRDAIYSHVADRRVAGVLAALAIGDQGAIERDDWDLFRNTGVAHLMSISGLHVTVFAWLAGLAVGRRGGSACERCCACRRRPPHRRAA